MATPNTSQSKAVQIGKGHILVTQEEFLNGFQAGLLTFSIEASTVPCSDIRLTAIFLQKLEDISFSSLYSMGFVVGWLATLANKGLREAKS